MEAPQPEEVKPRIWFYCALKRFPIAEVLCVIVAALFAWQYLIKPELQKPVIFQFGLISPKEYNPGSICEREPRDSKHSEFYSNYLGTLRNTLRFHNISVITGTHIGETVCFIGGFNTTGQVEFYFYPSPKAFNHVEPHLVSSPLCPRNADGTVATWWAMRPSWIEFFHEKGTTVVDDSELAAQYSTAFRILNGYFKCGE